MVSQCKDRRDSPVDPWKGISRDSGDTDGWPSLLDSDQSICQLDIRLRRNKAAWLNSPCVEPVTLDLPSQGPIAQNTGNNIGAAADPPLSPSPESPGDFLTEMLLSDGIVDLESSTSTHGSREKESDFLASTEEQKVLPEPSQQPSMATGPKSLAACPFPEVGSACFKSSRLMISADKGADQVNRRASSLNSYSLETFILPFDIDKENAHFHVLDMIISAMEKMKWDMRIQLQTESYNREEASPSFRNDQDGPEVTFYNHPKPEPCFSMFSESSYEGCASLPVASTMADPSSPSHGGKAACKSNLDDFVILGLEESNAVMETCGCSCPSKSATYQPSFNSAELLATELLRIFRKNRTLSVASSQVPVSLTAAGSIVVNEEQIHNNFESSIESIQEVKSKPRIRGAEDWAPPRFQIILNVHPPLKRDLVIVAQNFVCAGCGTSVEPKFVKRLRYCEYLGRYFCACCHSSAESCIPARILTMWDFRKYSVSNFSKHLLDSIWHQPIFNLMSTSHSLYAKAKELDRVKDIREQLFHVKKLLKSCSVLKAFEQLPGHLTDELHLFSMDDLVRTKKGLLAPLLKDLLKVSLTHVAGCELCQGKGFICEFCQSTTVIFPFQTTTCRRCSACRACFHKQCFQAAGCPRCARITARRKLLESLSSAAT
ncbi:protein associated with UVRAG as autophagy enhancer isoform X2 [Perognathus longimembris pacificus]|uniref:protein associated with UVRAG as autophagy enhancer isoform X2 n=1 Tax=Perognathus longimembris pacificus TaxID=214514 RepID=UPI0020189C65|nr:protein associated with UVRAG as autophagy enhancer isoform X2 [Perognathus longimembris pacificus]